MAVENSTPKRMNNRKRPLPDAAVLLAEARRIYRYEPTTGELIWIAPTNPSYPRATAGRIGQPAGGDDGHGYLMCMLLGHKLKVHQVVWLIHNGELCPLPLDHINRNRRDNRIENLRPADDQQNQWNSAGVGGQYAGVSRVKGRSGWCARLQVGAKKRYLGYFKTPEDAADAYRRASEELRGEFSAAISDAVLR